jgi:hypothetical protein
MLEMLFLRMLVAPLKLPSRLHTNRCYFTPMLDPCLCDLLLYGASLLPLHYTRLREIARTHTLNSMQPLPKV